MLVTPICYTSRGGSPSFLFEQEKEIQMTRKELELVKKVLQRIKNPSSNVELAIAYVNKDLSLRESQRDNFKGDYEEFPY